MSEVIIPTDGPPDVEQLPPLKMALAHLTRPLMTCPMLHALHALLRDVEVPMCLYPFPSNRETASINA